MGGAGVPGFGGLSGTAGRSRRGIELAAFGDCRGGSEGGKALAGLYRGVWMGKEAREAVFLAAGRRSPYARRPAAGIRLRHDSGFAKILYRDLLAMLEVGDGPSDRQHAREDAAADPSYPVIVLAEVDSVRVEVAPHD